MIKRIIYLPLAVTMIVGISYAAAQASGGQSDKDPYRNFVGNWSGIDLAYATNTSRPIALRVTEDQGTGRMLWVYWSAREDEKKYGPWAKWFVLRPSKNQMQTYSGNSCFSDDQYRLNCKVSDYKTVGLDTFNEEGIGHFTGQDGPNRLTVDLQETTLSYVLEFDDGKKSKILSKFVFQRINGVPDADAKGPAPKAGGQR